MDDLKQLIAIHGPGVWRTVYRMLNNQQDAQDCYQETFLAAWNTGQGGEPPASWPAWLKTVATRKAIDRLRQRYRQRRQTQAAGPEDSLPPHRGAAADASLLADELREGVRRALTEIPERQAQAFWLRHVEQLSRRETADQLGVTAGNVGVLVSRAAGRLRELLTEADEREPPTDLISGRVDDRTPPKQITTTNHEGDPA